MPAQALAHKLNIDDVDLEALDNFLRSDRAPPDSMMLSEVDGFLTGIAIGPELVRPSEWLPVIFGGDEPELASLEDAKAILGPLMARYNEILQEIADGAIAPIFWVDRKRTVIAMDWAEGFLRAIALRPDSWEPLFKSRDRALLFPILSLCCDEHGASLLELPPGYADTMIAKTPELIPSCALCIADYWHRKARRYTAIGADARPTPATVKVGRNDPCPCGSGRKFKRCCGQSGSIGAR